MIKAFVPAACAVFLALTAFAQTAHAANEAILNELYGSGVHEYFAGNISQAISDLSAVIDGGSKDPRAFYFRGLAEMRAGWSDKAQTDMQRGAAMESADVNGVYPVGKALERVQGSARLSLERYRAVARVTAYQTKQRRDAARYEQWKRAEQSVLRNPTYAPQTPPPPKPSAPAPVEEDPFADEKQAKEGEAAEDAMMEDEAAAKPAADTKPAEEMPADEPGAEGEMPSDDAVTEPEALDSADDSDK